MLAAASLNAAFDRIGQDFKAEHPNVNLKTSYAGSSTLVTNIQQGVPADVFASADQPNMQKVVSGGLASGTPRVFAHNKLEIVVVAGNPKKIRSVQDLARPGVKVDACAPGVPCGTYAATVFSKAGIKVTPVNQEDNVKAVVTRVSLGEVDAGIVYASDVQAGGRKVEGVLIPDDLNVDAAYPIVALKSSRNEAAAAAFIEEVLGRRGQQALKASGFIVAG